MNVSRLLELIEITLKAEKEFSVQDALQSLDESLQNMIANATDPAQQSAVASKLQKLKIALEGMDTRLPPAAMEFLEELEDEPFFSPDLAEKISESMRENAMTPVVVRQWVEAKRARRQQLLENLKGAQKHLKQLGFEKTELEAGTAELGFLIPRAIFDNTVGGLADEFHLIDRLVGIFSEAVTGKKERATLDELSTTDPLILLRADPETVAAIAATVTYILATYKQIVDIKEVKERTRGLKIANDAALKIFDEHIKKILEDAIDARINQIVPAKSVGRMQEIANGGLRWALKFLMSRIERGMKVEVKSLPPPEPEVEVVPEGEEPPPKDEKAAARIEMLQNIEAEKQKLVFKNVVVGQPVFQLEPPPPPEEKKKRRSRKKNPKPQE